MPAVRNAVVIAVLASLVLAIFYYAGYRLGAEHGRRDALIGQSCEPRRTHASPDLSL